MSTVKIVARGLWLMLIYPKLAIAFLGIMCMGVDAGLAEKLPQAGQEKIDGSEKE